jgi:hypothetical protein
MESMAETGTGNAKNTLYFGDNLDILRHRIPAASVDLIYPRRRALRQPTGTPLAAASAARL